jgi:uncharacterized protein (TIGR03435 family)
MLSRAALLILVATGATSGQNIAPKPVFDVASVKASPAVPAGQNININLGTVRRGEVSLGNATLSECIRFAYGLVSESQVSGPDWINDRETRFDILAKSSPDVPRELALLMLQSLLADRFKIELHREQRRIAHYALIVAKSGSRLRVVQADPAGARQSYGKGRIFHSQIRMDTLAMLLSRQLREPVLNSTGMEGTYDVRLEWAPDGLRAAETPEAEERAAGPSIFTALQEQLGLKLEARKDPLEVLVVDRAERVPLAN